MKRKPVLLRHGEVDLPAGYCYGHSDVPLSDMGREQAIVLSKKAGFSADAAVYCSDLERARTTAQLAFPDRKLHCDRRLRELDMGTWEGQAWSEIYQKQPDSLQHWADNWVKNAPPQGESGAQLYTRIVDFCRDVSDAQQAEMIVVAHAGSLRALSAVLQGRSARSLFDLAFTHCAPVQLI